MKKELHLFFTSAIFAASLTAFAQSAIGLGTQTTKNQERITKNSLKGSGMLFTPNKGQIADMKGNLHPEILYKGDGGGADVYLRKTGISYVTSNMGEVMQEINKEVELKKIDPNFSQQHSEELKHQLEAKASIKIQRTDVDFEGGNPNPEILNAEEVEGYTNYYYAHCPNGITNVKSYNRVVQKNIYKGIDVIYYGGKERGLKYDIVINPGADPNQIKLRYTGAKVKLNGSKLIVQSELGETVETLPKVYQSINGKIVDVGCEYKIANSEEPIGNREKTPTPIGYSLLANSSSQMAIGSIVTFELKTYNHELPLIIDPYWATYYGGAGNDRSSNVACDNAGSVYLSGYTASTNAIASTTGFQTVYGGGYQDAFLVKFNTTTGVRNWATYYGGTNDDYGYNVTCDNAGSVYLVGYTASTNAIASTTGFQTVYGGVNFFDAFLVKFNTTTGVRNWATYYGGTGEDYGYNVVCDNAGSVYLSGYTRSTNAIAGTTGFQTVYGGGYQDAFLVKFNTTTGVRNWATYYGGTNDEWGNGLACDNSGSVYLSGVTTSANAIASTNGFQIIHGGMMDAFLVKFNTTTGMRNWATYYGGTSHDWGMSAACDNLGNVYLAGYTISANAIASFMPPGFQTAYGGGGDAFLVQFNATTGTRNWGTYYGSNLAEQTSRPGSNLSIDAANNVYLYMEVEDSPGPNLIDPCAYQPNFAGGYEDQMIVKFNSAGKKFCATYLGGTGYEDLDYGGGIAIAGNLLFICATNGNLTYNVPGGYPVTPGAWQTVQAGDNDAVVASLCINICEGKTLGLNYSTTAQSICTSTPIKFTPTVSNSCDTTGYKFHWAFTGGTPAVSDSVSPTVKFSGTGNYDVKLVVTTLCKKDSLTKTNYITVNPCGGCTLTAQYTKGTANCSKCGCKEWIMVNATGGTQPYNYTWSDGYDKRYKNALCPGAYLINVTDKNGCYFNVTISVP